MSRRPHRAPRRADFYPERRVEHDTPLERFLQRGLGGLRFIHRVRWQRFQEIVPAVHRHAEGLGALSGQELLWQARGLRADLRVRGLDIDVVGHTFALVREIAARRIGLRAFDTQLIGGKVLLRGMVAEMNAGEGKTLTATLPASTMALAGVPVHVITVNDYLARRDAEWMGPVYEGLGLTVGAITHGMTPEDRRRAYRADITYCTNKEIVFDYLRDRLDMGRRPGPIQARLEKLQASKGRVRRVRLRGLCYGIVDEADSVLIDEARTPLIIAGHGDQSYELGVYRQALDLCERLSIDQDFTVDFARRFVTLTDAGKRRLEDLARPLSGIWSGMHRREDLVRKAITARALFHKDRQYVVKENQVHIVDEYTGRIMPGRSWEGGLHQLIETKENCKVTTQTETLGRISYQRFFRRYLTLAGMTGTAVEASAELWSVYRLRVVAVPTNRPIRRQELPTRVFPTAAEKWEAIRRRIAEIHSQGRPILVGTRSVADSVLLARLLEETGLTCRVLNAAQDDHEADIVSQAGRSGQITVATNMAGRGTDIKLPKGVETLGGLHVIASERHDAGRIDRQLYGRCGRQGDPGTFEAFVSLEDDLVRTHRSPFLAFISRSWVSPAGRLGRVLSAAVIDRAQRVAERKHFSMRRDLLRLDESMDTALAFAGRGE